MNQKGMIQAGLAVAAAGAMGVFAMGRGAPAAKLASSLNMRGLVGSGKGAGAAFDGLAQFSGAAGGSSLAEGGLIGARALKASPAAPASVRKIVRAATLSFEVKDQAKARALVNGVVLREGAEIFSEQTSGSGDNQSGVIVIESAPEKLEAILRALEPLGRLVSRSVSAENLSEEYVDLKSRVENLRKVEARLSELMRFKTHKLQDVLEVEHELARVGEQIEQAQGRMKYIDALSAKSRITVQMSQPAVAAAREAERPSGILAEVRNSLVGSFNVFVRTGLSLLNLAGFLVALGLWTLPATGLLWVLKKRIWG